MDVVTLAAIGVVGGFVACVAFAVLDPVRRSTVREIAGWTASVLFSLPLLPVVAFIVGLFLFSPVSSLTDEPALTVVSWVYALVLSLVVIGLAYSVIARAPRARFFAAPILVFGLGSVWVGRYLATVEWFLGPT
ncbi:Integral membrane protein OS=Tsukamurella paurometabola (strain ATCC 8368 / DSM / CCUG 35730/ CIP 100753 / JCM 10117 / KCTC 9821 / NBRC 16120 / NCIMB 702349/ NCTC 13040) OX=521096 GN=Tpau_1223 PE=4 SV=1 [Tsukamurella paurometabola]|uniref:Uncharacterized protein n=1 Tax=Tsukamurella paurometabola (strain ATCC 8368 / DSM 20162 / CCUG 35730 / CIP 100753 / JCM 10117 / KCTC 9821 / NBRC 16120 / NCIMB 702349 / NCTC 13040) TaxID=521096 RepID=D5UW47_TSUPD|nr:hypothetical protein [Tsukamurella paurometabola]ADG77854.1 hypothetical protein Tpau_1223 [Tsukamurella paurometabola DSM 20162]SUP29059.1 Uncharacterised protein [Tsukamurella paurometabola]